MTTTRPTSERSEPPPRASERPSVAVLFVCTGNICRSPTAEGVFRHVVEQAGLSEHILIDSAGTHSYHVGEPPDRRAQMATRRRGYDLSRKRARQLRPEDCARFDYLIAMDGDNYRILKSFCEGAAEVRR